ncbi:hypothetical protein VTO42DRAFT_8450 [Malbranchea cinnamomea]
MPIFQDPDRQHGHCRSWRHSPGGAEGHTSNGPEDPTKEAGSVEDVPMPDQSSSLQEMDTAGVPKLHTRSREELIRSIKRGESPTWVPSPALEKYFETHGDPPHLRVEGELGRNKEKQNPESAQDLGWKCETVPHKFAQEIERPKSALHSGDFREGSPDICQDTQPVDGPIESRFVGTSSPAAHWYDLERAFELPLRRHNQTYSFHPTSTPRCHSRAPSLNSISSSYVLKAPTSPLVYQANNPDLDFSPRNDAIDLAPMMDKASRRQTMPPGTFGTFHESPCKSLKHEGTFPRQSHQSRKSITSPYTLQPAASPQSMNRQRFRRQSFTADGVALNHALYAPMVGSYEESILRGRMSTHPSKPLTFTAQIGVLGRGNCKPNLRCPPHVTVNFPAVFYSYSTSGTRRCIADDSPSPYVGFIDLENSLRSEARSSKKTDSKRRHTSPLRCPCPHGEGRDIYPNQSPSAQQERRAREKRSRRSQSPQRPPGGCYRIPQQGQIQIVIKNPNKTAVKLFLIPYDLEGMEPGTKTFIRQRSYSVGPIIEPDESLKGRINTDDKPVLRYLAHLNICCTSKGRFYLYSGIRVVFANRVPDGKERLRNEIQYPDPRYSPYRPSRKGNCFRKEAPDLSFQKTRSELTRDMPSPPFLSSKVFSTTSPPTRLEIPREILFPGTSPSDYLPGHSQNAWSTEPISYYPNLSDGLLLTPPLQPRRLLLPGTELDGQASDTLNDCDIGQKYNTLSRMSSGTSEAGKSLLAIKLKNLDVMKRELESKQAQNSQIPDDQ